MCTLNRFIVNTNGGHIMRTCCSETRRDYLTIKLVIVYRWYENLPLKWNKIIPGKGSIGALHYCKLIFKLFLFHFFHKLITLFRFNPTEKKRAYLPLYVFEKTGVSCYKLCEENKSIKLRMLALKKKTKLSRLLVERINEFKVNEIQRKTPK